MKRAKGVEPDQKPADPGEISEVSAAGAVKASVAVSLPMPADADLRLIFDAWPALPEPIRTGILAMVKAAK